MYQASSNNTTRPPSPTKLTLMNPNVIAGISMHTPYMATDWKNISFTHAM